MEFERDEQTQSSSIGRWGMLLLVSSIAIIASFFVSQVIIINKLLSEIESKEKKLSSINSTSEALRTEISKLQSAPRIEMIAIQKLKMKHQDKPPITIP